jgi:putative endonuclease
MAEHNELGEKGEELARNFLRKKGYKIIETNWRFGKDLVIVEVKTRRSNYFCEPEFAVNKKKQSFLIRAAHAYIIRKDIDLETRFDIVSIIITSQKTHINHIDFAFYPTL